MALALRRVLWEKIKEEIEEFLKRPDEKLPIPRSGWYQPRPHPEKYKGGFARGYEGRFLRFHPANLKRVLQPFGGRATKGIRIDLREDVQPDIIADAHHLPIKKHCMEQVWLDPPYCNKQAENLYETPPLYPKIYIQEALYVLKPGGLLMHYHERFKGWSEIPESTGVHLITLTLRPKHTARIVQVLYREEPEEEEEGNEISSKGISQSYLYFRNTSHWGDNAIFLGYLLAC